MNGKLTAKEEITCINSGHRKSPPPPETCPLIYIFPHLTQFYIKISHGNGKCALSPVWLCGLMDCGPPGFSLHGILQARLLEWVAIFSSGGSSQPRNWTLISCNILHRQVNSLPPAPPGKPQNLSWSEVKWSCSVMSDSCDPMDCSLPGFFIHGIFQARVLEWVSISFSKNLL